MAACSCSVILALMKCCRSNNNNNNKCCIDMLQHLLMDLFDTSAGNFYSSAIHQLHLSFNLSSASQFACFFRPSNPSKPHKERSTGLRLSLHSPHNTTAPHSTFKISYFYFRFLSFFPSSLPPSLPPAVPVIILVIIAPIKCTQQLRLSLQSLINYEQYHQLCIFFKLSKFCTTRM